DTSVRCQEVEPLRHSRLTFDSDETVTSGLLGKGATPPLTLTLGRRRGARAAQLPTLVVGGAYPLKLWGCARRDAARRGGGTPFARLRQDGSRDRDEADDGHAPFGQSVLGRDEEHHVVVVRG